MARPAWTWKKATKFTLKAILAVVVIVAIGRHFTKTWLDIHEHAGILRFDPLWIVAAGGLYLIGLSLCGVFFGKVVAESPSPVGMLAAIRAYVFSHLGKYVPGKAIVVVMRIGLCAPYGGRPTAVTVATFYETFVMMGAGALVAFLGFCLSPRPLQWVPLALSFGLFIAFMIVVDSRVFPRLLRLIATPFPRVSDDARLSISHRLIGEGLLITFVSWVFLGLSQVAVIYAFSTDGVELKHCPLVIASVALATVAGFAVPILPGGLGVREWVLMTTLFHAVGEDRAVVAALGLRLTWVVFEALAGTFLMVIRPELPAPSNSASSADLVATAAGNPES